jgi:hypothetical protein
MGTYNLAGSGSMSRLQTITKKIERNITGLAGSLFVHVDFNAAGAVDAIRFSEKGKDDSTLDNVLVALGDATTDIIRSLPGGAGCR